MALNVVFAGTPEFASEILNAILKSSHTVLGVFTQPDRPAGRGREVKMSAVKQLALKEGLPIFQPISLKNPDEQTILKKLNPDVLIVVAYGLILPKEVLSIPKFGGLNVHASLLPRWRGAAPIQHAILAGDVLSGITIMQMDEGLDTGNILSLHPCALELHETSETLHHRLSLLGSDALLETLKKIESNQLSPQKQDNSLSSYASKITKAQAKLNWTLPASTLDRQIRAFNPWPVAFCELQKKMIRVYSAIPLPEISGVNESPFGTIVTATDQGIDVVTADGILRLLELQFPGEKDFRPLKFYIPNEICFNLVRVSTSHDSNYGNEKAYHSFFLKWRVDDSMKPSSILNTRALAALILTQVITQNRSLTQVLLQYKKKCIDSRDAAFLQTLCYGTLRFLPRIQFILHSLLKKSFKAKDQDIVYLLCVGIYQLLELNVAPHAAISESVDATRQLKKPWASGVVNAVLQNYLRQASSLTNKFQEDQEANTLHPTWLLDRFTQAWSTHLNEIIHANNHQAPLMLRVNRLHTTQEEYLQQLKGQGISAEKIIGTPAGIVLDSPRDVTELPGFNEGYVSVQDGAAQLAAQVLDLSPGLRVLDACAAPGGKTADILETEPALSEVVSLDISAERTQSIRETLTRLHLKATVKTGDALYPNTWWDNILFDRILLDAPCSATGVIRRHPDIKFLRQPEDITNFSERQLALLKALWPLLKPNGILVYATCSILPEENELVVEQFLQHVEATLLPLHPTWGIPLNMGWQFLPGQNNSDGFYYVRLLKAKK